MNISATVSMLMRARANSKQKQLDCATFIVLDYIEVYVINHGARTHAVYIYISILSKSIKQRLMRLAY